MQKIQTSIRPEVMRRALIRATLWGIIGGLILILSSLYLPVDDLTYAGPFLVIFSFGLIAWAFRPLQKLKKLEVNPQELLITELALIWNRHTFPLDQIQSITYQENKHFYGIVIQFKSNKEIRIPYFTERSFKSLKKI